MAKNSTHLPGDGFLGWMGRQIGHVKKAIQTDVTAPADAKKQPPGNKEPPPQTDAPGDSAALGQQNEAVIYRNDKIEEVPHPQQPNMKLRRTTIDEVIVTPQTSGEKEKPG